MPHILSPNNVCGNRTNKRMQQFEEVLAKERRLRHGGGVDAGRLELGVGPLDDRVRPLGLIGQAEFRIAKARPLSRVRRDAGSEVAFERISQGVRRCRMKVGEPLDRLLGTSDTLEWAIRVDEQAVLLSGTLWCRAVMETL